MKKEDKSWKELWRETPFVARNTTQILRNSQTKLPFTVGCATQQGPDHMSENINNQDALGIIVEADLIAAVVCDGCTGSHPSLKSPSSNNEIGAKLISYIIVQGIKEIILNQRIKITDNFFLTELEDYITNKLSGLINIIFSDREKLNIFISDFFMTTILVFIVTENDYVLFHSGDGLAGINSKINSINESGSYFSSRLIQSKKIDEINRFKILKAGIIEDLQNIFIATDGFNDVFHDYNDLFVKFIEDTELEKSGFDPYIVTEFRKKVIWSKKVKENIMNYNWFKDDATFVVLRRTQIKGA